MEAVVLCGIQGSGKTTLYRDRFLETHVRISLDLLRTRHREAALLRFCLDTRQPFVVDNTNPTPADRRRYTEPAHAARFRTVGYLVEVPTNVAIARNAKRERRTPVPVAGVLGTRRRFVRPTPEEGFDELWHATSAPDGGWRIEPLLVTPELPGMSGR
jgi:predicted kinase